MNVAENKTMVMPPLEARILSDPMAWHMHNVQLEEKRIQWGIESLEETIEKANAQISKLKPLLEKAKARSKEVTNAFKELKPGDSIPRILLPNADDLKDESKRIAREMRESTNNDLFQFRGPEVEGWYAYSPRISDKKIAIEFQKEGTIEVPPMPEVKNFSAQRFEIDLTGTLRVTMVKILASLNLSAKHIAENLRAGLEAFKENWKKGTAKNKVVVGALKTFYDAQEQNESPVTEKIRTVLEKMRGQVSWYETYYGLEPKSPP